MYVKLIIRKSMSFVLGQTFLTMLRAINYTFIFTLWTFNPVFGINRWRAKRDRHLTHWDFTLATTNDIFNLQERRCKAYFDDLTYANNLMFIVMLLFISSVVVEYLSFIESIFFQYFIISDKYSKLNRQETFYNDTTK